MKHSSTPQGVKLLSLGSRSGKGGRTSSSFHQNISQCKFAGVARAYTSLDYEIFKSTRR